jgi:hypothetical protein
VPGIALGPAFVGEIVAIGVMIGLTSLAALGDLGPGRRVLAATLIAVSYLTASSFAQGTFKELAQALFVLAFAIALRASGRPPAGPWARLRFALPFLALASGVFFSYSFAGLAWPVAILALWGLTLPEVRRGLAPRALLRFLLRPATLATIVGLAAIGASTRPEAPT